MSFAMSPMKLRLALPALVVIVAGAAFELRGGSRNSSFPPLSDATGWLNSPPLSPESLRGKVVLVDFWTFTCTNWMRTLPYLRAWKAKFGDKLVIVGAHTPEFSIERDPENVRLEAKRLGVDFPIALDNHYGIWNAFSNQYWPALYVFDVQGRLRHQHFGEGGYEQSERIIWQLIEESGVKVDRQLAKPNFRAIEEPADELSLRSPETYVGIDRTEHFVSPGGARRDLPHNYRYPERFGFNAWALSGEWTVGAEIAASNTAGGRVAYRFQARDVNLVMAPPWRSVPVKFRVLLDGKPPGVAHGSDVDSQGVGTLTEPRLYQLIRQRGSIGARQFEIEFLDPGARVFSFTFG
jgi:thiol-disulfide isomerase/thioredoxin